jgi:hypothetical protein
MAGHCQAKILMRKALHAGRPAGPPVAAGQGARRTGRRPRAGPRQITISGGILRPTLRPGPIRPLFRVLGIVVGPVVLAGGALMVLLDLHGARAASWPAWSRALHVGLWLGLGNMLLGWLIVHVARSGHDPYVIVDEEPPPRHES